MAVGKNIKGITIEFAGDTTKLGKALDDVNKKTKSVDDQLKAVDKALKFNPGNTELLAQKQQLLGQRVEQTKQKLTALKDAQAKLDDDPAVDKTSQDYMELRREIIETESQLKHFEGKMKELNNLKFEQVGQKFKDIGGKMQAVGTGMTKYVTGPILAVGAAATASFNEVQQGLNIVTQKTGATGEALEGMHTIVKEIAKDVPADFETIGSAVGEVNTRFGLQGDELESLSAQYVKFAKVNDTDVSDSIDNTQKALSAFGLGAKDAGNLLDILTRVSQNTGASVDDLTKGLIQNGTAFQEMGLDVKQSAVLMGQLEKSGANGETVMQGLRKALKAATKDGVPLNEALANLQDTIKNGTGSVDGLTAAYDLFGKSGDQIYGAVKSGTIDFTDLAGAAEDMSGVLDRTFEQTLTPAEQFQTTVNALKVTGYEIANTVLPMLMPVLKSVSEKVQQFAEMWTSLSPETRKMITIIAGIVAAVGPLLVGAGKLISLVGTIVTVMPALATAFAGIAGPIGIVVAAIGALIAIGVLLYKNWDTIKAKATEIWTAIKETIGGTILGIEEWFKHLKLAIGMRFNEIKKTVSSTVQSIKDWFKHLQLAIGMRVNLIKTKISDTFSKIKEAMLSPIKSAVATIKDLVKKIKEFFNFKVSLPHIKLPHFSIDPPGWKLSDLLEGIIPSLGIKWYAKGGIFNSPTVAGLGDVKGGEAALPLEPFWNRMDRIVEAVESQDQGTTTINVYASDGMDVRQLALEVEQVLVRKQKRKERVFA